MRPHTGNAEEGGTMSDLIAVGFQGEDTAD
jgi:hypothetical protein